MSHNYRISNKIIIVLYTNLLNFVHFIGNTLNNITFPIKFTYGYIVFIVILDSVIVIEQCTVYYTDTMVM